MSSYNRKPWSVDIVAKVKHHLAFLQQVDSLTELHEVRHIQNAVRRYECMWLPLLSKHRKVTLEPPLDVHWIWHCHLLSPKSYIRDCEQLLSYVPDHTLPITDTIALAKSLWEYDYPEEPFNMYLSMEANRLGAVHRSALSYDLVAAARRQRSFYYNVSLPHYSDPAFIYTAADRYAKFLNLKKHYPDEFLVPMYDVDLMWHTHQLFPHAYRADTVDLLGFMMNHNDDITDHSPGSKLATSDVTTKELWRQTYGEELSIPGTLYRGDTSDGKLFMGPIPELNVDGSLSATIDIHQVTFNGGTEEHRVSGILSAPNSSKPVELPPKKGLKISWSKGDVPLMSMRVDSEKSVTISGQFSRRDGIKGRLFGKELCTINIDTKDILTDITRNKGPLVRRAKTKLGNYNMGIQANIQSVRVDKKILFMKWGLFVDAPIPENTDTFWGPVKFPQQSQGAAMCRKTFHNVEFNGQLLFTVRIMHSQPLQMSVVQVYYKNKMVVCSQLIGPEQLPTPEQVDTVSPIPNLDSKKGERGMLIKNCKGDYGIITAKWVGFRRGSPTVRGDLGHLSGTITRLGDKSTAPTQADFAITGYDWDLFHQGGVTVSHRQDKVYVDADCTEVPEMLAAAFSAGVLLLLCEPQPELFLNKGEPTRPSGVKHGMHGLTRPSSPYDVPFFHGCGYMEPTCSNSWLYWYHYSHQGAHQADGPPPYCPWDPDGVLNHCNDALIACDGGKTEGLDTSAICGGCAPCSTSMGGAPGGSEAGGTPS